MKVLIYGVNFAPEQTGIGKYSGDMAAWLAEVGHDVRVIAAPPYYPTWKCDPAYVWPAYRRENWRGVKVWRAPLWVPKVPDGLSRIFHLLSFAVTSFPLMLLQIFWRPGLVLTIAPAFVCAPAGWLVARLTGAQCWLHLQDFEIDVAFEMKLLNNKLLQRIVLRIEKWCLQRFDSVSSISNRMVERLLQKGVKPERTRYFPNWADLAHIKPSSAKSSAGACQYREQLRIARDAVVVLFSGSMGGKQGLMVIPTTAALLSARTDIVFVICGDGVMKPVLEAASDGLTNVRFLPLQPLERLGDLLSMADMHLLPQTPSAADLVLPSKLSGMLASGRPVIATCNATTEIAAVVQSCGLVVAPENAEALAAAVCQLADDSAARLDLGRRARDYAETYFDRDAVLERMFGAIEDVPALPATVVEPLLSRVSTGAVKSSGPVVVAVESFSDLAADGTGEEELGVADAAA